MVGGMGVRLGAVEDEGADQDEMEDGEQKEGISKR